MISTAIVSCIIIVVLIGMLIKYIYYKHCKDPEDCDIQAHVEETKEETAAVQDNTAINNEGGEAEMR